MVKFIDIYSSNYSTIYLPKDTIHIWLACLADYKNELPYFYSLLSTDELERANKLVFTKHQSAFITARGILRVILSKYLRYTPQAIKFLYNRWGKPYLPKGDNLYFNVSHAQEYALYGISNQYEVGIDIEYKQKNLEWENLAKSLFSVKELAYWGTLNLPEKIDFFFKFWVSKEAYLKTLGKGWLDEENKFEFMKGYLSKQQIINSASEKMSYPVHVQYLPDYVSAWFIDGPMPHPHYYTYQG